MAVDKLVLATWKNFNLIPSPFKLFFRSPLAGLPSVQSPQIFLEKSEEEGDSANGLGIL